MKIQCACKKIKFVNPGWNDPNLVNVRKGLFVLPYEETIESGGKTYKALHFNFSSTDKKLNKGKKLNTDVWYDEQKLNWVKASFEKKGKWEYKLVSID